MASTSDYDIRPANDTDEFRALWWRSMRELDWNRCYHDIETYTKPSKSAGMLLAVEKSTGNVCGHVGAVINANSTGWVSMFIVDAAHRGRGLGRELFKSAMAEFQRLDLRAIGLDGVAEQKGTYERRGFVDSEMGRVRIMLRPLAAREPLPASAESQDLLVDVREVPYQLLVAHELDLTGFERLQLWCEEHLFARPDVTGFAIVSRTASGSVERVLGWTLVRRSSKGCRLGPVYAGDVETARRVVVAAVHSATAERIRELPLPDEPISELPLGDVEAKATIVVEVWDGNPEAVRLFESLGWVDAGVSYHRMWLDGKATPEFSQGGAAQRGVFAIFDAAVG